MICAEKLGVTYNNVGFIQHLYTNHSLGFTSVDQSSKLISKNIIAVPNQLSPEVFYYFRSQFTPQRAIGVDHILLRQKQRMEN